ncbi:hypothetical protein [Aggregatibacter kilianii]|jgi:hypothetical protein|uniref:hypothetical protein n=1 Tax=Aggregatibacter kilianii TaxID=2025884 RepID=UPI002065736E|nr:hypothetical protein [Aggregatibacter kilianii]DAN75167.1 MAG TPA: hypothetical protein [Bacteriophage sp.]
MSKIDWASVDWSMRTCDIAKSLNVSNDAVSRARSKYAGNTLSPRFREWQNIDWTKNNRQLACELGKSYDTVAKKRYQLGYAGKAIDRAVRVDKGVSKTTNIPSPELQKYATEQARKSPKSGKFETNIHAKKWRITSPDSRVFIATNLYQFVRDNTALFFPGDVIFKRTGGKRGTGGEYCNATSGLLQAASSGRPWKGWKCKQIKEDNNEL